MAALTAPRNTDSYGIDCLPRRVFLPMKASTKIYAGALVVYDAGYAAPMRVATGLTAIGRAVRTVDNSSGSAGALTIEVERGHFGWDNSSAGDLIAQANLPCTVYGTDDHTVALTNGTSTRSAAGRALAIDPVTSQVIVETY